MSLDNKVDVESSEVESSEVEIRPRKSWIPPYLANLVTPYCDEIWCTPFFDERLVAQLMSEGFLPIASSEMLLPKLHLERCVIRWSTFHVSKSVKKKGKRWDISVNREFDRVVQGCHAQHGVAWLYPPIVRAFEEIHRKGTPGFPTMVISDGTLQKYCPVRLYSIEVWSAATGALVAGELGYTVGNVYTSLTGFSSEDGAGSAQLAALGTMLQSAGFKMWDLGMYLSYKERLGARQMSREEFVNEVRQAREEGPDVILSCPEKTNIHEILRPKQFKIEREKKTIDTPSSQNTEPCMGKRSREISPVSVQSLARSRREGSD